MKAMPMLVCSIVVLAVSAGIARADDPITDPAVYKQKMHDCVTQAKTDHPDQNYKTRRTACHKQLGPSPKTTAAPSTAAPAPAPTSP